MATRTLAQKLYIRPGYTVALLNAPKEMAKLLDPLPDDVKVVTNTRGRMDLVLSFVKSIADLEKSAKDLKGTIEENVILWFAYPKQSGKTASELTRDHGWKILYDLGFQGVASVAIDNAWTALRFKRAVALSEEQLLFKQYEGARTAFRPLYEKIVDIAQQLGPDVEIVPRQSYVALSRGKQFGLVKPARDHLDVVLKLPDAPLSARLEAAGGLGSGAMTHRVAITKVEEIDRQLIGWIQDAYRAANKQH